ncbi:Serine/threonine-protein kinase [Coemansia sp. IMI 203386]|nr:Serine/threonine-protein kinase [Coemansia sp. IMI 203386]
MSAKILCSTNDVDQLFAADADGNLGSRLEFSLNLDMITDHGQEHETQAQPTATERPHVSRRKTLRRLISTHVRRTSELHICGGTTTVASAASVADNREELQRMEPLRTEYQLELISLPSPFASFDRGLSWPDIIESTDTNAIAEQEADPLQQQQSSISSVKHILPKRRESIGSRPLYSGMEPDKTADPESEPDEPDGPDTNIKPETSQTPRRGRSLMFKPLMDVTAVGALIDNIANDDRPQTAKPRAQSIGLRRGLIGSLRRTAAALTASSVVQGTRRRGRSTAGNKEPVLSARPAEDVEHLQPRSHAICPIETVQADEPQEMAKEERQVKEEPQAKNDKPQAKNEPAPKRSVRRRAGTLNLGSTRDAKDTTTPNPSNTLNPVRLDRLKGGGSGDNKSQPLIRRRHQSQRQPARNIPSDDALLAPGYIPIAVSLKSTRSRQFLLNTPLGEFEIQRTLGQGSYGKVKLMRSALSHELFAVKIIKRYPPHKHRRSHPEYRKAKTLDRRVVRESNLAAILGQLHPHIVPLHDFRVTDTHFYLFYAYVDGVTLAERVGTTGLNEDEARAIFKPVAETVAFCHRYSVIHRDIKLENVLLDYAADCTRGPQQLSGDNSPTDHRTASVFDGRVKLIDFGLANFFDGTSLMETFCGSLPYTAPEILRGDAYVGPEIDVWSLGVLLYVMLTGQFPFDDPAQAKNFDKIMAGDFALRPQMSRELQDLLVRMLEPNAKRRIAMKAVLNHAWLKDQMHPGICCQLHPYKDAEALHDRRTLLLPGPEISHLVAGEVATCLDRSFDDVLRILESAISAGKQHKNAEQVQASANVFTPARQQQRWPAAWNEFYSGKQMVQVPNSPVVSVYALVMQQISLRRYYLELPATDEGKVKGHSSSSATMDRLLLAAQDAATLSSSSHMAGRGSQAADASGGLRSLIDIQQTSVPVPEPEPAPGSEPGSEPTTPKPRTLATRLASRLGTLGSTLVSAAVGTAADAAPTHWQQQHPSSGVKLKSARALTALELTHSAMAPAASPVYTYNPVTGQSMPSLTTSTTHKQSLVSRMRSRSRQSMAQPMEGPFIRTLNATDHADLRITLPADLAGREPAHVLGLVSALLKLHEIAHTFVETRNVPVQRAMDAGPIKDIAAGNGNEGQAINDDASDTGPLALRSLFTLFSRPPPPPPAAADPVADPVADPARPRRRLTQLRDKVHRRPTLRTADRPTIVHPQHIQPVDDARTMVTTQPVKHLTATILAQYSPSLNRMRETEVMEYYSCAVRLELVRVNTPTGLRQPKLRYALLVDRMTGHKGKYALFRIFLQRMVAALPSLSPEPMDPRTDLS